MNSAKWLSIFVLCTFPTIFITHDLHGEEKKEKEQKKSTKLPPGILARVNGKEITLQDYSRYLFVRYGRSKLEELIDRILVENEASRLLIEITPEDVEKEVKNRYHETLQGVFNGDQSLMEKDLLLRGRTLEEYKLSMLQTASYDLLRDSCILKTRKISDSQIKAYFDKVYGVDGVRHELRHLVVGTRELAEKILGELKDGVDFIEMVRAHSTDSLTKKNDGRIPVYHKNYFGVDFDAAVGKLTEASRLTGIVKSPKGYHLIHLVEKQVTKLQDKEKEIRQILRTRNPGEAEKQQIIRTLREKGTVEK